MIRTLITYYAQAETEQGRLVSAAIEAHFGLTVRSAALGVAVNALHRLLEGKANQAEIDAGELFVIACYRAYVPPPPGVFYKG